MPETTDKIQEEVSKLRGKVDESIAEASEKLTAEQKKALEDKATEIVKSIEEKGFITKEDFEAKEKEWQEQFDELALERKKGEQSKPKALKDQLKENLDKIKTISKGQLGEVVVKADTVRASITDNEQAYDLPDIGQLATRRLSMYDIFPKFRISESNNNGTIRYYDWDEATIARAAAMVAENGTFPESTAKWKKYSIDLKKIGDTLPVSEEFFEDEAMFAAELTSFMETNGKLVEDQQIAKGDGTGENLTGLTTSVDAYTASAEGMQDPSRYDLVVKVSEDITTVGGSKYSPDVIMAPQSEINKMRLKKDQNNNYILPPFVTADGQRVDGMLVIECNVLDDNTMVIGDRRFGRIYEKTGWEMSRGYTGTQFVEDMMTLKLRKRLLFLIRNADKGAFRKVTDVDAALVTLGTNPT